MGDTNDLPAEVVRRTIEAIRSVAPKELVTDLQALQRDGSFLKPGAIAKAVKKSLSSSK